MLKTGFASEIITPARGKPLAGYFNARHNKGVLDNLQVKVLLFNSGSRTAGLIAYDLITTSPSIVSKVRGKLKRKGLKFGDKLLFCATHTHTGPAFIDKFQKGGDDDEYIDFVADRTVNAVIQALANLAPSELASASVKNNPFAFNRRYFMKDGKVVTNPGKLNPAIVKPEGPVDDEIGLLSVEQHGRTVCLVANIVNHTDTIGGELVSADWPGRLEREVQNLVGYDLPVLVMVGCSGNINHFDVKSKRSQTCYEEAKKIGRGYAEIVARTLKKVKRFKPSGIAARTIKIDIPTRKISQEELAEARSVLKKKCKKLKGDVTSEDLAKGESIVNHMFADHLVKFAKTQAGRKRQFELVGIKIGSQLSFASLPGEPFTEIGLAIKKNSPSKQTFVASLAHGACGYVPMSECFGRGGYETLPVLGGGPRQDVAEILINRASELLKKL